MTKTPLFRLFLISIAFLIPRSVAPRLTSLPKGSFLSVEKHETDVLHSPDGTFSCGFHRVGTNAFSFSIWFSEPNTVVWTANRERPVNGKLSKIAFLSDGRMALLDADGTIVWSTTSSPEMDVSSATLLDSGNLVVQDSSGKKILWQSFDSPTDTLLPGQPITKHIQLLSSSRDFVLKYDSYNVLRLIYDGPDISSIYWPNPGLNDWQNGRTTYNSSKFGALDDAGRFTSSDLFSFDASDMSPTAVIRRRLTLDPDGNLRLYSLLNRGQWSVSWQALPTLCKVHGMCGRNGICINKPESECSCPVGYRMANASNWREGCEPIFNLLPCNGTKFVKLPMADYYGYDLIYKPRTSLEECSKACQENCNCQGFVYKTDGSGNCYGKSVLFNGYTVPDYPGDLYLKLPEWVKIPTTTEELLTVRRVSCDSNSPAPPPPRGSSSSTPVGLAVGQKKTVSQWVYWYATVSAFGLVELLFMLTGWLLLHRSRSERGYQLITSHFQKFSYAELRQATGNFTEEVGRGGSGEVYKGVLPDGRVVAVKKLPDVGRGEEEFRAELSTIGRIYHLNLVRMWGFCLERSRRLLVYEFVERGSLANVLFDSGLGWRRRFGIAVGIAKGLAYLHHECLEWVIHCDIKPENILLDGDYEAKIADFGLVQLTQRESTSSELKLSRIRGTKGYMAPEWTSNVPITAKVDVYSYGVILLELLTGERIAGRMLQPEGGGGGEMEVREWVCGDLKEQITLGGKDVVRGLLDPRLQEHEYDLSQATVLLELAISCLEFDRHKRPTMDSVVHTLLSSQED